MRNGVIYSPPGELVYAHPGTLRFRHSLTDTSFLSINHDARAVPSRHAQRTKVLCGTSSSLSLCSTRYHRFKMN